MTLVLAPGALASLATTPGTFGAVETVALNAKLPANTLQVGTTLRALAKGTVSAGASGTVLGRIRAGTAGTTADTAVCASTAQGAAVAAVGWKLDGLLTVRTIGSGGTCLGNLELAVAAAQIQTLQTATVSINTTVDNFLDITLIGGGTTPVVTIVQAVIEVIKP